MGPGTLQGNRSVVNCKLQVLLNENGESISLTKLHGVLEYELVTFGAIH